MRISTTSPISVAVALLALVGIVWAVVFRSSISSAVPAGRQHSVEAVPAPPDAEKEAPSTNNFVSVEFMNHGSCYAGSHLKDTQAIGGFTKSDNVPRNVQTQSAGVGLFLLAQPGVVIPFDGGSGMRVTLVNQTQDLLAFNASDSRLAIVQEALDPDGTWKPIESLPSSDCGNSYHRVFLAPDQFWAFSAPRYKGTHPTKLRFTMTLADGSQLHSNVFDGSVNPAQFTLKQGIAATSLLVPDQE